MSAEQTFGMIAKNRRRELGLTQDELAKRVGCAPITLRKIEADDLRPSVQIAERMAMALNIPLEERSAFVKLARVDRAPVEEPTVTPMPLPNEIGIEDLSGRAIRGYALGERLGNGGMGVVYRAVQPLVEREVAIKIILPQYANHPDFIRRFEAEAQLVARLEHPHIVPLYDYWREPSVAYLIMRLLRGGSVQSLLRNGTVLTPETVLRMMEQIGSALSSAHRAGVVHRDLKPANVLLDEDNNAYLADFGIAKNLSSPSSDTQADMVIGSPDYISPEQIKSEFVRPQTDIYALGVMLYELLTGRVPFHGPTPFEVMHQHLSTPLPSLAANRSGLPKALDAVIEHATEKDPLQRYETVDMMLDDLRRALGFNLREIKSNAVTSQPTAVPLTAIDNPYKGLRAFGEGDAQDFYGREALTQQLLVRLGEGGELARFLAVVGPSGSGKSSVVKAGLIPALRRGALPGSENWFIVEMLPGAHPLEELEAALLRVAVNPPASLMEQFQKDSRGLIRAVRRSLPNDPNIELVLVIDQFEEVFTLLQDETERLHFLGLLVSAVMDENSRIRVVLTLRADFIDRPLNYVDFGELLHQRMELVLPLTPDELESAIAAPAERVGLRFESGLVSAILRDLGDQPGTLPLLQYALTELYEKRAGNTLTKSAYQEIGGVLGALGRRAEEVFTGLESESQTIAKQLFLRLVTLGEGVEDTRRRALIAELENLQLDQSVDSKNYSKSFQKVLDSFGKARLLSFDRDPDTRGSTVEVAHEAIIREWTRLRDWLNESRTLVRMQRQLANAAAEWEEAHRDHSFLLTGTKLAQYEGWIVDSAIALTLDEINYLKVSITERDKREIEEAARQKHELETAQKLAETEKARAEEQTQSVKRLHQRAWYLVGALILAMIAAVVAGGVAQQNKFLAAKNADIAATAQAAEEHAKQSAIVADEQRVIAENERLASDAYRIASNPAGNSELAALLSIRAMKNGYNPKADAALVQAMPNLLTRFVIYPDPATTGALAYSPDGSVIAIGLANNTVQLREAKTGKFIRTLTHDDSNARVIVVSFSPDGKQLLVGNTWGNLSVIDLITGQTIKAYHLSGLDDGFSAEFSSDGRFILGTMDAGTINVWEISSGKQIAMRSCARNIGVATFSPDSKYILFGCLNGNSMLGDLTTGQIVQTYESTSLVWSVAFSPDSEFVLVGSDDNQVRLYETLSGKLVRTFMGHLDIVFSVAFSSDGKSILTGSADNTVRLWNVNSGQQLFVFSSSGGKPINKAVFSPDGSSILAGSAEGKEVREWRIPKNVLALNDPTARYIPNVVADLSKQTIAVQENKSIVQSSTLKLVNAQTGDEIRSIEMSKDSYFALSPDNKSILISAETAEGFVTKLIDINTGRIIGELEHNKGVKVASFSSDGSSILVVNTDLAVRMWNIASGNLTMLRDYPYILTYNNLALASNGKNVLLGLTNGIFHFLTLDVSSKNKILGVANPNMWGISAVAFSPDGQFALTGDSDGLVQLWNIDTGEEIRKFKGHTIWISSVTFSPDGKYALTASSDQTVRLWDINTGDLIRIYNHKQKVSKAIFSQDGKFILSNGTDGARLWDTDYHDTIRAACSLLLRDFTDAERLEYNITDTIPTCPKP